jgi:hypothetical protein
MEEMEETTLEEASPHLVDPALKPTEPLITTTPQNSIKKINKKKKTSATKLQKIGFYFLY